MSSLRSWGTLYQDTVNLASCLKLRVKVDKDTLPVAPSGSMFWARTSALKKTLQSASLNVRKFDTEAKRKALCAAMERIYGYIAQDNGYYYADVINTDDARSDLVNLQHMLYGLCEIVLKKGFIPYSYSSMQQILNQYLSRSVMPAYSVFSKDTSYERGIYYYWKYRILSKILRTRHYKDKYQRMKIWKESFNK